MKNEPRIRRPSALVEYGDSQQDDSAESDEDNGKAKADPNRHNHSQSHTPTSTRDYATRDYGTNMQSQPHSPLIHSAKNHWQIPPEYRSYSFLRDRRDTDSLALRRNGAARKKGLLQLVIVFVVMPFFVYMGWDDLIIPAMQETVLYFHQPARDAPSYGVNAPVAFKSPLIQLLTLDPTHLPSHHEHHSSRLIVVGDVHGCKDELVDLLDKVGFYPKRDHLILAGDMIDKGPNSNGVIKLARRLGASCVRGNHEDKMLLEYESMSEAELALLPEDDIDDDMNVNELLTRNTESSDESAIVSPYRRLYEATKHKRALHTTPSDFSRASLDYLTHCPVILRVGNISALPGEMTVVHAGLTPNVKLPNQDPYHVMTMRTIDYTTGVPSSERSGKHLIPWWRVWGREQKRLSASEEEIETPDDDDVDAAKKKTGKQKVPRRLVVYGHDSKQGLNRRKYSVGLDSGCVKGGRLSGLVIEVNKKGKARMKVVSVGCRRYV